MIGDDRLGDNLYTDSVVALDARTGALKWHFQFTPHDVWDYDAEEPTALVDTTWQGKPRKLLIQANRNGFFYVLDRTNGEFLFGTNFVKNITWATGLDARGRPLRVEGMEPSPEGKRVCPSLDGATNWYSASFNPADESLLRADERQVRHLHPHAAGVGSRQGIHGRVVPPGAERAGAAACCARSTSAQGRSPGRFRRPAT